MRLLFFTIAFLGMSLASFAQGSKYIVYFKDKSGSPYSVDRPAEYLSPRALERRKKHNVAINENDIPINPAYVGGVLNTGVKLLNRSKWLNAVTFTTADVSKLDEINRLTFVSGIRKLGIEPVKKEGLEEFNIYELLGNLTPAKKEVKDPEIPGKNNGYGKSFNQIDMLKGIALHQQGFMGQGVVVAILDAGFFKANELEAFADIRNNGLLLGTRDFVANDGDVFNDDNHGMNALSCMAANLPGKLIGTAPKAGFWLLRSEDGATEYPIEEANWVTAAEFADSVGADIISSSLGYTSFDDLSMSYEYSDMNGKTTMISRGATIAASKGILVINSAGNAGDESWKYIGAPADADSVLSVGAVDEKGEYVSFSSKGPASDGRIKPNVAAKGKETIVASPGGGVNTADGTSFSCPIISGMAACLIQANPERTNMEIMDAIQKSSNNYATPDALIGYGVPDFDLANKILGGDKEFNAKGDQLLQVSGSALLKMVQYSFFSKKPQTVLIQVLDRKSRVKAKEVVTLDAHSFNRLSLINIRKLKKGAYSLVVTAPDGKEFAQPFTIR